MVEMTGNFDRYEDGEIPFSSMKIVHVLFLEQPIPRMGAEDGRRDKDFKLSEGHNIINIYITKILMKITYTTKFKLQIFKILLLLTFKENRSNIYCKKIVCNLINKSITSKNYLFIS